MSEIAVVGAGPAGAYCAFCLAEEGLRPVLFDDSHPREKPCGGGLSPYAQEAFPFLKELPFSHGETNQIQIAYATKKRITLTIRRKFIVASRLKLDQFILDMATASGARLERVRVIGVEKCADGWKVKTGKGLHTAKVIIGADGVRSLVRKVTVGSLPASDLGMGFGYLTKSSSQQSILLKFLPRRKGYIWLFPRDDHVCVGIAADLGRSSGLKAELDRFLRMYYPDLEMKKQWTALIPILRGQTLRKPAAGPNWILIGDAAGHVDPVSGEGIPYALRSAELAASAICQNSPELYDRLWREDYGGFLSRSAKLRNLVFRKYVCTPYFILASLIS